MAQDHGAASRKNAEFIWQITPRRQSDDLGFAQPHFQIKRLTGWILEFKNPEAGACEGIHSENAQVVAGNVRESGDPFDKRRGGGNAGCFGDQWKNPFGQVAPDFEIGAASNEADGVLEARERAPIRHLNRQENGNADGYAENVEQRQKRMRGPWTDDLPPEKSREPGSHSGFFTAARCKAS